MSLLEILMGFLAGLILIFLATLIFKVRMRTEVRLILNSFLGIAVLFALNFFRIAALPLNLFNAFVVGFLGVPGIVMLYLIVHIN